MVNTTTFDSDTPFVTLRNTISGVSQEYTREDAERFLNHSTFGKSLIVVDSTKPEVLAEPYTVSDNGDRIPATDDVSDTSGDSKK